MINYQEIEKLRGLSELEEQEEKDTSDKSKSKKKKEVNEIVEPIKRRVRTRKIVLAPKKDRHSRILSLDHEQLMRVDAMLFQGTALSEIARVIKDEWGLFENVAHGTVEKQLARYKVDHLEGAYPSTSMAANLGTKAAEIALLVEDSGKWTHQVDTLQELVAIAQTQKGRLEKILKQENKLPTLLGSVRPELESLARLIMNVASLQMDLGLMKRAPTEISGYLNFVKTPAETAENAYRRSLEKRSQQIAASHKVFDMLDSLNAEFTEVPSDSIDIVKKEL